MCDKREARARDLLARGVTHHRLNIYEADGHLVMQVGMPADEAERDEMIRLGIIDAPIVFPTMQPVAGVSEQ